MMAVNGSRVLLNFVFCPARKFMGECMRAGEIFKFSGLLLKIPDCHR